MRVSEIMTGVPKCCTPSTTARAAATMLKQLDLGILLVVDDLSTRKLVGILTDRDLCLRALAEKRNPEDILVDECMTKQPTYCTPRSDVRTALALMAKRQVRRLPVVDRDNRLQGIVTLCDIVRHDAVVPKDIFATLKSIMVTPKAAKVLARAA